MSGQCILAGTLAALEAAGVAGAAVADGGTFAEVTLPGPDPSGVERLVACLPDHGVAAVDVWAAGVVVVAWAGGDR